MITAIPIFLFILLIIFLGLFMVKQQTAYIIERFGKYNSIRSAGLQFKIPFIDRIAARLSLRIQQLDVVVETKTKDDVFVHLKISVQYQILRDKVYDAFYRLQNPHEQLTENLSIENIQQLVQNYRNQIDAMTKQLQTVLINK